MSYNTSSIKKMEAIEHIRKRPGMYLGSLNDVTNMVQEVLDNAIDEVHGGHADKVYVYFNTKKNYFIVGDNGRGIPFDEKLDLYDDPPVMICNSIFSSGKFDKDSDESSYKVSSGLHGVGLTCVYALSNTVLIDIFKNKKHARYTFEKDKEPTRKFETNDNKKDFSTVITVFPNKKYFESLDTNYDQIENKLAIAVINYPNLKASIKIDDKVKTISGTEEEMLKRQLSPNISKWFNFEIKNKKEEKCIVKFNWDFEGNNKLKNFSTVNLLPCNDGAHVNKAISIIKSTFSKYASKFGYEIDDNDLTYWLRLYVNLHVIDSHFESQTKTKLSKKTDLSLFDNIEKQIDKYFKDNDEETKEILKKFDEYKKSLHNKKVLKTNDRKRGTSSFTKLRDCTKLGGELFIGEGESACGSLIKMRDPSKHAVLPLKGVPLNCLNATTDQIMKNVEIKDIITACGCGITPHCDISKLRYDKIIIAADADPDGAHITSLLIISFAKLMPDVIKNGNLYVCETPLFGYGIENKFIPIWTNDELEKARKEGRHIKRFKGLGEFSPVALKRFTLDTTNRKLIKVDWSNKVDKIFELLDKKGAENRRLLSMGEWKL